MPNTSASGGPLSPSSSPTYGLALNTFIQNWMVPLIGLPGDRVVVYDQAEPPNIPDAGTAWAAIRVSLGDADAFPFVGHNGAGQGSDQLQRHEVIECLASFYDLGSSGLAQFYAAGFRDGTAIPQNREPLFLAAMGLVSVGKPITVPVLLKQRWMYRVDLPFSLRRQVVRVYEVENVLTAGIVLKANVEGPPEILERTIPVPP